MPEAKGQPIPPMMSDGTRREVEHFFIRRGVPQLIDGYATEARMDASAAPYIAAWLLLGTVLYWGTRPGWPAALNAAGIVGTVVFIGLGYAASTWARHRRLTLRPTTFDVVDIGTLGLLPGIASGLIEWSALEFIVTTLNALLGIGVIYVAVGFGVIEIVAWALRRLSEQLSAIIGLVARTLPVLLILVVFLLFAAEIWEVAAALSPTEMGAVIVLLGMAASLLVVTTAMTELRRLEEGGSDLDGLREAARRTAAGPLVDSVPPHALTEVRRLGGLEKGNMVVLMLFSQLLQSAFVALMVGAFLAAFGLLVLPLEIQQGWSGQPIRTILAFTLLGDVRILSAELVTVSGMLGGIVGLYFTGLAVADSAYRPEHFGRVVEEARELLSARAVYLAALRMSTDASRETSLAGAVPPALNPGTKGRDNGDMRDIPVSAPRQ